MIRKCAKYLLIVCLTLFFSACSEKQKSMSNSSANFDELITKIDCYSLNEQQNEQSLYYSYQVNYGLTGRIESFDLIDYLGLQGRMKYQYSDDVISVQYRMKPGQPFYEGYASVMDDRIVESSTYGGEYGVGYYYDDFNHLNKIVNIDGEELRFLWKNSRMTSVCFYPDGADDFAEETIDSVKVPRPGYQLRLDLKYKKISSKTLNLDVAQLFLVDMVMNCGSGIGFSDTLMELCSFVGSRCSVMPDTAVLEYAESENKVAYKFMYGIDGGLVKDIVISRNGVKIFRMELSYIKNPIRYV